ncbi:hypothetical protein [Niabella ginsengisoli]|uniref:Beta-lactamase-inhibitor-like PepSY-like domain-containing protein n=1 Tax=Niabella ginsengisoli TaxID=522298 RepID=A0ABS9SDM1_9BACT|nr:hypothetical protein [Niabella ginsengisoli]MCH5596456.1 hypothetical protein [Niabella ginsengisoli]
MKNLILSTAVLFTLTVNALAAPKDPVSIKVQETFNQIFKNAADVSWTVNGSNSDAFFTVDGIKTRATLNANGTLIQTIRYYSEEHLPASVLYNIKKSYKSKEIFGVTEVSNHNGINYRIVLKDDKHYTFINANSSGDNEVVKKYKRGDK